MSLLRNPGLHFAILGLMIYIGLALRPEPGPSEMPIVIGPQQLLQIRTEHQQRVGRSATAAEEAALIQLAVEEEILYRESRALGLDRNDGAIRARLVMQARFLSEEGEELGTEELLGRALELGLDRSDIIVRRILVEKMRQYLQLGTANAEPDERELAAYLDAHAEEYERPAQVTLTHIFFSRDRRKERVIADAESVLARLRSGKIPPDAVRGEGDPFPLGSELRSASQHGVAKAFGMQAAAEVMQLGVGVWSGPIESAYGTHLVWLKERFPSRVPELAEVRSQLRERMRYERRQEHLARSLQALVSEYDVQIQDDRAPAGSGDRGA